MDFITNPFILAILAGLFAACVTYVYLKKTQQYGDDDEQTVNKMTCLKVAGLTATTVLMVTGYTGYVHGQFEEASLATEFFQTGQPQF